MVSSVVIPGSSLGGQTRWRKAGRRLTAVPASRSRPVARPARSSGMRLTRRGRMVVLVVATVLLVAAFSLGRVSTTAATSVPPPVAYRSVVVAAGDTLWEIASTAVPDRDPRLTVEDIRRLNHLRGVTVQAGQQLLLPPG